MRGDARERRGGVRARHSRPSIPDDASDDLFSAELLAILGRLDLLARRARVLGTGERAGRERGGRVEFREHRDYASGDDLRYVDWNAYGRLERLFVKEFAREEEVRLRVVLDASASMGLPGKWRRAAQLAAALAYVALAGGHTVRLSVAGAGPAAGEWARGEAAFRGLLDRLRSVRPAGDATPAAAIRAEPGGRRDRVVVISDFWETDATRRALGVAAERGAEVTAIQLFAPDEAAPAAAGPSRLVDAESGELASLDIDDAAVAAYGRRLEAFLDGWRSFAARRGIRWVVPNPEAPLEETLLESLREGGLLG